MADIFQATIGGKFIELRVDYIDIFSITTIYNTAMTDTAIEILGKECRRKEGAKEYRKTYKRV